MERHTRITTICVNSPSQRLGARLRHHTRRRRMRSHILGVTPARDTRKRVQTGTTGVTDSARGEGT